jgi:hypothetical protein
MLNPDETVVLLAARDEEMHLVGFHPQPGNYEVYLPPGTTMPQGSRWDFLCPVCRRSLVTEAAEDLCALDVHTVGEKHRVFFSRVAGEQATFVVTAEGLLHDHGIHTDRNLESMVQRLYTK